MSYAVSALVVSEEHGVFVVIQQWKARESEGSRLDDEASTSVGYFKCSANR
jgi:hypothetical protein